MAALKNVMAWIIQNYPHERELSNARLTKMVYLSDWHHTVYANARMTDISWYFDNHGPFVWDIKNKASEERDWFRIVDTTNMYGSRKTIIELKGDFSDEIDLAQSEKTSISKMIERTKGLYWDDFITFVYSTFPILVSEKYSSLDLEALAERFRLEKGIAVPA
ncbi:Panacea domain-containing protein [Qipengyuania nanhaisediminis]|uniref:Panacea domain-containing protein n=1 Tax=Qipengyuania nanhaisediminis TaxID=604088 RepID=UPI0038B3E384